jgi:MarR family
MQVRLLGPVDGEPRPVRGLWRKAVLAVLALRAGEVDRLERDGYVTRAQDPQDRRRVIVGRS